MNIKEMLKSAGIPEEYINTAANVVSQYIAGDYIPKERFNEVNEKNKALAKELGASEERFAEVEKRAKKAEDALSPLEQQLKDVEEDWKFRYEELENQHKEMEELRIMEENYNARSNAVKNYIKDSAYDTDMIMSLLDFDALEIKDGKVMGVDKAVEALRKEKGFLFKSDDWEPTAPTSASNPNSGNKNFGEMLAESAQKADALTQAAAKKYFG